MVRANDSRETTIASLADDGVNQERGKFPRKSPIGRGGGRRREEQKEQKLLSAVRNFSTTASLAINRRARASLCPQIQLFGKLNLSKSRRASWVFAPPLPPLPPCRPSMKGRPVMPQPSGLGGCPVSYYIDYLFPTGSHGHLPRTYMYVRVYVWLDLCTYACIFIGIEWRIR